MKKISLATTLITCALFSSISYGEQLPNAPHISVTGKGEVTAQADMATLIIEVNVHNNQVSQAKKQVDAQVARYFTYLHQQGVTDNDIDAANVSTQPIYDYSQQGKAKLNGYQASRQVTVTLHQLAKLNPLLDGALASGLSEIRSVTLGVAQPQRYQQQALQAAISDAISKAGTLAKGFAASLGPVWSINDQTQSLAPTPRIMLSAKAALSDTAVDSTYQQTKLNFNNEVQVVFTLHPSADAVHDDHKPVAHP